MAKRKKQNGRKAFANKLLVVARKVAPHEILKVLAKEYNSYIRKSQSGTEQEFWIKCSRASANLASGMEKWLEEFIAEEEEEGD